MDLSILKTNPELAKDLNLTIKGNDLLNFADTLIKETTAEVEERIKAQENGKKLLTRKEVCAMLGVTLPTLWRWEKKNILVPLKIGNKVCYRLSDVEKAMK